MAEKNSKASQKTGRPKMSQRDRKVTRQIYPPRDVVEMVDAYRDAHYLPSWSSAVVHLIVTHPQIQGEEAEA